MIVSNRKPIPLYNRPDIASLYAGHPLKRGEHLLIGIEMVLLEGSKIEIVEKLPHGVYQVTTPHYRVDYPVYVDARHVDPAAPIRTFRLPGYEEVLEKLYQVPEDIQYIYGANLREGLPYLREDFIPKVSLSESEERDWILKGLDCSGLFFEICAGATVRNCSMLHEMGETLTTPSLRSLQPLDLILTPKHVVIVESSTQVIECARRFGGVKRTPLTLKILEGARIVRPALKKGAVPFHFFS